MNKGELINRVAETTGQSEAAVTKTINAALDAIQGEVAAGGSVTLANFGTFQRVKHKERKGYAPKTGQPYTSPAKHAPKFSAGGGFKAKVAACAPEAE